MNFFIKIASLFILISSFSIFASEDSFFDGPLSCEEQKKTVVIYSNGMFNNENDILKSKVRLEIFVNYLIQKNILSIHDGEIIEYDTANNIDESITHQFADVVYQKLNFTMFEVRRYFSNILKLPFKKGDSEWEDFTSEMASLEMLINNDIIDEMVVKYESYLKNNYRVIIVAHSQGNMYATAAYGKIMSKEGMHIYKDSISIVSVGSPIDTVARGEIPSLEKPHATAFEDLYMWGVRVITLGSNSSTFKYENSTEDYMGHSFINAYMFDKNSKKHIANGLNWAFSNTKYPKVDSFIKIESKDLPSSEYIYFEMSEFYSEDGYTTDYYSISEKKGIQSTIEPIGEISIQNRAYYLDCANLPKGDFGLSYDIRTVKSEGISKEFNSSYLLTIGDHTKEYPIIIRYDIWGGGINNEIRLRFTYDEFKDSHRINISHLYN